MKQNETVETKPERVKTENDHSVEIDGSKMNANVQGSEEPDAQVVVLLPGNGGEDPLFDYEPLIAKLGDCRVVTIDPFGAGLSENKPEGDRSKLTADDIYSVLEKLSTPNEDGKSVIPQNSKYTIVAHSAAGAAGQEFAASHPEETQGFVGIDAYLPGQDEFLIETYDQNLIPDTKSPTDQELTEQKYKMRFPETVPTIFVIPDYLKQEYNEENPNNGGAPELIKWRGERLSPAAGSQMLFAGKEHFAHHDPAGANAIAEAIKSLKLR
ncbi:MAG: alpha/beta hydrolase [Candidatus Nomurabacteria bacterium]|jgi:pimeloyl-ACP methyl ester carboxylesterase|nr:alpha/beta hydrolase [Candidatus Nomurabacteria bacterium]